MYFSGTFFFFSFSLPTLSTPACDSNTYQARGEELDVFCRPPLGKPNPTPAAAQTGPRLQRCAFLIRQPAPVAPAQTGTAAVTERVESSSRVRSQPGQPDKNLYRQHPAVGCRAEVANLNHWRTAKFIRLKMQQKKKLF